MKTPFIRVAVKRSTYDAVNYTSTVDIADAEGGTKADAYDIALMSILGEIATTYSLITITDVLKIAEYGIGHLTMYLTELGVEKGLTFKVTTGHHDGEQHEAEMLKRRVNWDALEDEFLEFVKKNTGGIEG
jgi:hypothetical protein